MGWNWQKLAKKLQKHEEKNKNMQIKEKKCKNVKQMVKLGKYGQIMKKLRNRVQHGKKGKSGHKLAEKQIKMWKKLRYCWMLLKQAKTGENGEVDKIGRNG